MKNILFLLIIGLSLTSQALVYSCELNETIDDQLIKLKYSIELGPSVTEMAINSPGGLVKGKISFDKNRVIFSNKDVETEKYIVISALLSEGEMVRFVQNFSEPSVNIYDLVCTLGDKTFSKPDPDLINCKLIETTKDEESVVDFQVPLSENGHDTTELPKSKFGTVKGWVMAYKGLLGLNMADATDFKGRWVGAFGSIQGSVLLEWFADKDSGIKSTIACEGKNNK